MGDRIAIMRVESFAQVGTAEELVCHLSNDYVREFTEDVPRYQVLTARSVMKPANSANATRYAR